VWASEIKDAGGKPIFVLSNLTVDARAGGRRIADSCGRRQI